MLTSSGEKKLLNTVSEHDTTRHDFQAAMMQDRNATQQVALVMLQFDWSAFVISLGNVGRIN